MRKEQAGCGDVTFVRQGARCRGMCYSVQWYSVHCCCAAVCCCLFGGSKHGPGACHANCMLLLQGTTALFPSHHRLLHGSRFTLGSCSYTGAALRERKGHVRTPGRVGKVQLLLLLLYWMHTLLQHVGKALAACR